MLQRASAYLGEQSTMAVQLDAAPCTVVPMPPSTPLAESETLLFPPCRLRCYPWAWFCPADALQSEQTAWTIVNGVWRGDWPSAPHKLMLVKVGVHQRVQAEAPNNDELDTLLATQGINVGLPAISENRQMSFHLTNIAKGTSGAAA